ncbi:PREDICTED: neurexin-3-beta-like [Priapulus caudatus]|uniref:Neurexin-3-beta-like n=1 Tax=Priapulus caudatus TaxID=37621 RepID=A0ABM1EHJ6_PRICU|nr:PREDICTED: neurexin-3-beta-like [Priapulus caudatus]
MAAPPAEKPTTSTVAPPIGTDESRSASEDRQRKTDSVGLIIGIAVAVLIALLALIAVLYRVCSKKEGTYKVDESKNYGFAPTAVATTAVAAAPQANGGIKNNNGKAGKLPKKKDAKDVKEWYV